MTSIITKHDDIYFQKYLKYKIKYFDLLQLGGTKFILIKEKLVNSNIVEFTADENFSLVNRKNLIRFFESINLKLKLELESDIPKNDKTYTLTFVNPLTSNDELIIKDLFKTGCSPHEIMKIEKNILPWSFLKDKKSKLLYISLNIKSGSEYHKISSEPHISLCQFNIRNDSELDKKLTNPTTFKLITDDIQKIIISELYGKQLLSPSKTIGNFGAYQAQEFTASEINMDNIRNKIIIKLFNNAEIEFSDFTNYGKTFRFFYDKRDRKKTEEDIKLVSQLAQGQYEIIDWKPHVSLGINIHVSTELHRSIPTKLNLWYSNMIKNPEARSEHELGDFEEINIVYNKTNPNKYVFLEIKLDPVKLVIKKCSKK
jgi:hypothetical protein